MSVMVTMMMMTMTIDLFVESTRKLSIGFYSRSLVCVRSLLESKEGDDVLYNDFSVLDVLSLERNTVAFSFVQ